MQHSFTKLENIILEYLKKNYMPKKFQKWADQPFNEKDMELFAEHAGELSDAFTIGRMELPASYFNKPQFRSAYLLYFTLINVAKLVHIIKRTKSLGLIKGKDEMKILDVGCGPAVGALSGAIALNGKKLNIFGLEQNAEIAKDGKNIFESLKETNQSFHYIIETIGKTSTNREISQNGPFDIIIIANLLNEFKGDDEKLRVSNFLIDLLTEDGVMIIIDPALQKTARSLMELRNSLIEGRKIKVLDPCLHQKNCPMLEWNKRDWCHSYIQWRTPHIIKGVDKLLGLRHEYLKLAYLIICKSTPCRTPETAENHVYRVVSSPLRSKGKIELLLCSDKGEMIRLMRLDRDRSELNHEFDEVERGDLVEFNSTSNKLLHNEIFRIKSRFNAA